MENVPLLLFYFMCQRMRCSIRRRASNRRKRRMFLILHRIKQNLLFLQSIQTATLTLLVAAARVVHPRLERKYWPLPSSQTKISVVRAHPSRRSSVSLFERAFSYTQGYLATSESRSLRDIQERHRFSRYHLPA